MITFLFIIGLIISFGLNVSAFLLIRNLLKKQAIYEAWILEFKHDVQDTYATIQAIDHQGTFATSINDKGNFESDDQVGQVFKELHSIVEKLNERTQ